MASTDAAPGLPAPGRQVGTRSPVPLHGAWEFLRSPVMWLGLLPPMNE